jgi:uncharacterized membrane protein YbhN (UPF0104 family)
MAVRTWWPWAASLALTLALFTYLLSQVDVRTLWTTATRLAPGPLLGFFGLALGSLIARATRFCILLGRQLPLSLLTAITVVRNLFVDLLPARVGELSYVYLLVKRGHRPVEDGLATLLVAFLLDVIALAPLLFLAILVVGGGGHLPIGWLIAAAAVLGGLGYVVLRVAGPVARALAGYVQPRSWRRADAVAQRLRLLADSLGRSHQQRVLLPALALSLLLRLCKYGSVYCLILSIMTPLGYRAGGLGFFRVFLAAVSAELAAALPIHGLAGFGTYEAAWTFSFVQLGFPREHAVVSGILGHAIGQVMEYLLGGLALLWLMRPSSEVRPDERTSLRP